MARYQIIVSYDGTNFYGSQRQGLKRTVQGELEKALTRIGWAGKSILMAGRTDTGVHASGQVAAFDLDWNHELFRLLKAINSHLPEDLVVREISPVAASFHPRFDAVSRTYRYCLFTSGIRNPLRERYAWRVWPEPQFQLLEKAAAMTRGVRNYAAFGAPTRPGGHTIRDVIQSGWQRDQGELIFEITANAFLYHMVRRVTFIHVRIGQGLVSLMDYQQALENGKSLSPGLAAPQGLTLVEVNYPPGSDTLAIN